MWLRQWLGDYQLKHAPHTPAQEDEQQLFSHMTRNASWAIEEIV
jgi:hypothetical protein